MCVAVICLLMSGCQSWIGGASYGVPAGSSLILRRPLSIPPGRAAVYIQYGETLSLNHVQHYEPFCSLELRDIKDVRRTVQPDTFAVSHVQEETLFAARQPAIVAVDLDNGAGSRNFEIYAALLDLRSARQPQVFRLTCQIWRLYPDWGYPTRAEIERALGDLFTLAAGAS